MLRTFSGSFIYTYRVFGQTGRNNMFQGWKMMQKLSKTFVKKMNFFKNLVFIKYVTLNYKYIYIYIYPYAILLECQRSAKNIRVAVRLNLSAVFTTAPKFSRLS